MYIFNNLFDLPSENKTSIIVKNHIKVERLFKLNRTLHHNFYTMALTNNDILKKLRVALKLRDEDIIEILKLVDFRVTKSELGAFFRKEDHPNYVPLQDQILRNFLKGEELFIDWIRKHQE